MIWSQVFVDMSLYGPPRTGPVAESASGGRVIGDMNRVFGHVGYQGISRNKVKREVKIDQIMRNYRTIN